MIYGAGRLLHRGHKGISDEYCISEKSIRSVYFATHFNNFYQASPIDKIIEYMEELVLWGCNCISMWFDMHHFSAMTDAKAKELLERMRIIYEAAKDMGFRRLHKKQYMEIEDTLGKTPYQVFDTAFCLYSCGETPIMLLKLR